MLLLGLNFAGKGCICLGVVDIQCNSNENYCLCHAVVT